MLNKKLILPVILSLTIMLGCAHNNETINKRSKQPNTTQTNEVTIFSVGDIMAHQEQLDAQIKKDGSYNFNNNYRYIKNIATSADISIANLETTINPDRTYAGYPSFNTPPEILSAIKNAGFDVLSTINNHALDTGSKGVISTAKQIQKSELKNIGTKSTSKEKKYIIEDIKGIKFGFAAFSYGEIYNNQKHLNGIPSRDATDLLNVIDSSDVNKAFEVIKNEIDNMRNDGAEYITLSMHWGTEYQQTPIEYQTQLAQMLANEGVDLILGSHPHVVQPMEYIKSKDSDKECLVIYSQGNIISDQTEEEGQRNSENGIMPVVKVKRDTDGEVKISDAKYIPSWTNKYNVDGKDIYEIIPINDSIDKLTKKYNVSKRDLTYSYENTKALMKDDKISPTYIQ